MERIKYICSNERIKAPSALLSTLVSSCHGDIRGAINALQFALVKSARTENHNPSNEYAFAVADHKQNNSVFDTLANIYHSQSRPGFGFNTSQSSQGSTIYHRGSSSSVTNLFDSAWDNSDSSLILNGMLENIHNVPYADPSFSRTAFASDWLSYGDSTIYQTQIGGTSYLPIVASALHILCAVETRPQLEWPRKYLKSSLPVVVSTLFYVSLTLSLFLFFHFYLMLLVTNS